jgi:integrase
MSDNLTKSDKSSSSFSKPKLLDQVRMVLRVKHFSIRTEQAYVNWIRRFIFFHKKRHPRDMGETEIREFISDLAVNGKVSASTQTVALSALLFLYREVLKRDLLYVSQIERAKSRKSLPAVFTRGEVRKVLSHLEGTYLLIASLLYGSGLRLLECRTTMIYTHVLNRGGRGVRSPLDERESE